MRMYAQLTDGLSWASRWQESYSPPSKSAISRRLGWLGSEPVAALFARVAAPGPALIPRVGGWRGGVWWRSMVCVWMWLTRRPMMSSSGVRGEQGEGCVPDGAGGGVG